ncbi:unnamed protein product [Boreogadus saida]
MSKFTRSPWQQRGNGQQCLDRSRDQSRGSSASGVRLQGAGEEMNSVFCNLDGPRPDCLLSRALPVVGSPLGRTGSFTGGSGDNRGSSVALRHLGPNKRMAPRRRMGARLHSLNGSHAAGGDGTKHTVKAGQGFTCSD